MPKKLIHTDGFGNATGNSEIKTKRKSPAKYITPGWLLDYWRGRDRILWQTTKDPETKEALKKRYNVK